MAGRARGSMGVYLEDDYCDVSRKGDTQPLCADHFRGHLTAGSGAARTSPLDTIELCVSTVPCGFQPPRALSPERASHGTIACPKRACAKARLNAGTHSFF